MHRGKGERTGGLVGEDGVESLLYIVVGRKASSPNSRERNQERGGLIGDR